ncbi:GTPase activating protein [Gonapodya sp. JEL0774]|nr:GTPase activating protein [Gonapodya sp. JEL0774]
MPPTAPAAPDALSSLPPLAGSADPAAFSAMPPPLFSILDSFSLITRSARDAAVTVLAHPLVKPLVPLVPRNVVHHVIGSSDSSSSSTPYTHPFSTSPLPPYAPFSALTPLNPDSQRRIREISRSVDLVSQEYETAGQYAAFLARELFAGRYGTSALDQDLAASAAASGRAGTTTMAATRLSGTGTPSATGSANDILLPEDIAEIDLDQLVEHAARADVDYVVVSSQGTVTGGTGIGTGTGAGTGAWSRVGGANSFGGSGGRVNGIGTGNAFGGAVGTIPARESPPPPSTSTPLSLIPPTFPLTILHSPTPPTSSSRQLVRPLLGPISPEEFLQPDHLLDAHTGALRVSEREFRRAAFERGFENDVRWRAWEYLVGVVKGDWSEEQVAAWRQERSAAYFELKHRWIAILDAHPTPTDEPPSTLYTPAPARPTSRASTNSHVVDYENQAPGDERVHVSGGTVEEDEMALVERLRERKWRIEKDTVRTDRTIPLFSNDAPAAHSVLPAPHSPQPGAVPPSELPSSTAASSSSSSDIPSLRLLRDVLMTYCAWNGENMGYVQGMNEWASVCVGIAGAAGGEVDVYELLSAILSLRLSTFSRTSTTISSDLDLLSSLVRVHDPKLYVHLRDNDGLNMFCCFRWLLVWFKREVQFAGVSGLWEVFLSAHLHVKYYLFFALTLLTTDPFRSKLMEAEGFDGILKACNEVSEFIQNFKGGIEALLVECELVFYRFNWKLNRLIQLHIPEHARLAAAAAAQVQVEQGAGAVPALVVTETESRVETVGGGAGTTSAPVPMDAPAVSTGVSSAESFAAPLPTALSVGSAAGSKHPPASDGPRGSKSIGMETLPYAHRWLLDLKTEVDTGLGWAFGNEWKVGKEGWELNGVVLS